MTGDIIWTLNLPDLAIIGNAISTNKFVADRIIALTGSSFNETCYVKSRIGCSIEKLLDLNETNSRIISGNVLTGTQVGMKGHLRFYSNEITAIPEGNDYDLFGWAKPMFNKFSVSRALTFSWLFPSKTPPKLKKFQCFASLKGQKSYKFLQSYFAKFNSEMCSII